MNGKLIVHGFCFWNMLVERKHWLFIILKNAVLFGNLGRYTSVGISRCLLKTKSCVLYLIIVPSSKSIKFEFLSHDFIFIFKECWVIHCILTLHLLFSVMSGSTVISINFSFWKWINYKQSVSLWSLFYRPGHKRLE